MVEIFCDCELVLFVGVGLLGVIVEYGVIYFLLLFMLVLYIEDLFNYLFYYLLSKLFDKICMIVILVEGENEDIICYIY